jgi:hypothetical protein
VRELPLTRPGGDREMVDILLALESHDLESLGVACDLALSDGLISAAHGSTCWPGSPSPSRSPPSRPQGLCA